MTKLISTLRLIFATDLRSLALMRISTGIILLYDLIHRLGDFKAFYSDYGVLPRVPYISEFMNKWTYSIHLSAWFDEWQLILFGIQIVLSIALIFGLRTKFVTIVSWFLLVSLHNRNPYILNAGDSLLRAILFWGMFLPWGYRCSVDAAMDLTKENFKNSYFSVSSFALILQVLLVYVCTAILKSGPEWVPEFTASYYALNIDALTTSFGVWLSQFHEVLRYSTMAVLAFEYIGPFLFIAPIARMWPRTIAIAAFIFMHLNFELTMRIGLFPYVDAVILLGILPTSFWDEGVSRFFTYLREKKNLTFPVVTIYYDKHCGFCRKSVYVLCEILLIKNFMIESAQDDESTNKILDKEYSWIVKRGEEEFKIRYLAGVTLLKNSQIFFWTRFLPLDKLNFIGEHFYKLIAHNRDKIGTITASLFYFRPLRPIAFRWVPSLFCALFIYIVVAVNASGINKKWFKPAKEITRMTMMLRMNQRWSMFAPYPMKDDGWFIIPGKLIDDREVDVYRGTLGTPTLDKPELVSAMYSNARWRKYMLNLWAKKYKGLRLHYGKYLCRVWRDTQPTSDKSQLANFSIKYMREYTALPGQEHPLKLINLWNHDCYGGNTLKVKAEKVKATRKINPLFDKSFQSGPKKLDLK